MRKHRYTAEQMLAAVKMADAGTPVAAVCRSLLERSRHQSKYLSAI